MLVTLRQERENVENHAPALIFSNFAHIFQGKLSHMTMSGSIGVLKCCLTVNPGEKPAMFGLFPKGHNKWNQWSPWDSSIGTSMRPARTGPYVADGQHSIVSPGQIQVIPLPFSVNLRTRKNQMEQVFSVNCLQMFVLHSLENQKKKQELLS